MVGSSREGSSRGTQNIDAAAHYRATATATATAYDAGGRDIGCDVLFIAQMQTVSGYET